MVYGWPLGYFQVLKDKRSWSLPTLVALFLGVVICARTQVFALIQHV